MQQFCFIYTPLTVSLFLKITFVIGSWLDGGVSSVNLSDTWRESV